MNNNLFFTHKRVFNNPSRYLKFLQKNKELIVSVKVVPAKLAGKGFGRIEVETNKVLLMENNHLQAFKESLKNINREEFLKLIAEIEAEPQDEKELTVGEFLDLMKN